MTDRPIPPRLPDWHARLTAYVAANARARFRPGRFDCALFAAGAVDAMTGSALAETWCARYSTMDEGREMLRADGHADHIALAASLLRDVAPAHARPGDVGALEDSGAPVLGIVQGAGVYVMTLGGLALASRLELRRAFSV